MNKVDLKAFDIETYDIEIEFNKKIAPIHKKIEKIEKNHETKSLKVHKDFLSKEKKSQERMEDLEVKTVEKIEKTKKATANKLSRTSKKEDVFNKQFQVYKEAQAQAHQIELEELKVRSNELEEQEIGDLRFIQDKYKKNVESYIEKLYRFNSNFENNKLIFSKQYNQYRKRMQDTLKSIEKTRKEQEEVTEKRLAVFVENKMRQDEISKNTFEEIKKKLSRYVLNIRKKNNTKSNEDRQYISELKQNIDDVYENKLETAHTQLTDLQKFHKSRIAMIKADLEINLEKIDRQIANNLETENKRILQELENKKRLLELRASTTIEYESSLQHEKTEILSREIGFLTELKNYELLNFDKLFIYLMNDNEQLKDSSEFFKTLNLKLMEELTKSEIANNAYSVGNEKLEAEFINNYTKAFNEIKRIIIDANQARIDQLTTTNSEIDDIDKFLDTVEPLKEIELNNLREIIEKNEVEERYKIRYAKQRHEAKLLENNSRKMVSLEELNIKNSIKDNNVAITEIMAKETMDIAIEEAKLKYSKAEETKKLRLNNTKLEVTVLNSSYEAELEKSELKKELAEIEVVKNNAVLIRSLEREIANIEIEANYKAEVVTKSNEEDILQLHENVIRLENERDDATAVIEDELKKAEKESDKKIKAINNEFDAKLALIDEAMSREIRKPLQSIARNEAIIEKRMQKFELNYDEFDEYYDDIVEDITDESYAEGVIADAFIENTMYVPTISNYLERGYKALCDAAIYVNDLSDKKLDKEIKESTDESKKRRLKRQKSKNKAELKRLIGSVIQSQQEQINRITNTHKADLIKIIETLTDNEPVIELLLEKVKAMRVQVGSILKSVAHEASISYKEIMVDDHAIVDHANRNAIRAKEKIERERETRLTPLVNEFSDYLREKTTFRDLQIDEYNASIQAVKDEIQELKDDSIAKTNQVNEELIQQISVRKLQLEEIKREEKAEISRRKGLIDSEIEALRQQYESSIKMFEEKDKETEKIYDYEGRIYQLALDTAESKYRETVNKAKKATTILRGNSSDSVQTINEIAERNIERINKELLEETTKYENNLYTVRPRYEESIGDAQRAIEDKANLQNQRKTELIKQHKASTKVIEDELHASFEKSYKTLQNNLNSYIEEYGKIEDAYKQSILSANEVISKSHSRFVQALYELGKQKIDKTNQRMSEINDKLK